jgi:hypothetical protein
MMIDQAHQVSLPAPSGWQKNTASEATEGSPQNLSAKTQSTVSDSRYCMMQAR